MLKQATGLQATQAHKVLLPHKPMVRNNSRDTKRQVETLVILEDHIYDQEMTIQRLSRELEKAGKANASGQKQEYERMQKLSWEIAQAQARLDSLMVEWERVAA